LSFCYDNQGFGHKLIPMATPPKALVARVRTLLNRLVECRRQENDDQEVVHEEVAAEVRTLPREGLFEALDKAVGTSRKRREEAVYVLSELTDIPGAVERIGQSLKDPDPKWRSWLIQTVANRKLRQFAPLLNEIIEHDPDEFSRDMAIHAAGALRERENLPTLLRLAGDCEPTLVWRLAVALGSYATEECRPFLRQWFEDERHEKSTRIFAAWGLGKLGDAKAVDYLIAMLHDPDRHTATSFEPGQSIRAAQAVCDIHGWPFEWNKAHVAKTIALVEESGRTNGLSQ
jgi:hypothetical protein